MAGAMVALFAVTPPIAPLWWFSVTLIVLFSAFSFLTIAFYAEGVAQGRDTGRGGHLRLAGWREGGALVGVSLAAVAPVALVRSDRPALCRLCAAGFALLALVAALGDARANGAPGERALAPRRGARCAMCWPTGWRAGFCCWRW